MTRILPQINYPTLGKNLGYNLGYLGYITHFFPNSWIQREYYGTNLFIHDFFNIGIIDAFFKQTESPIWDILGVTILLHEG